MEEIPYTRNNAHVNARPKVLCIDKCDDRKQYGNIYLLNIKWMGVVSYDCVCLIAGKHIRIVWSTDNLINELRTIDCDGGGHMFHMCYITYIWPYGHPRKCYRYICSMMHKSYILPMTLIAGFVVYK